MFATPPIWRTCCGWAGCPRPTSPPRTSGSCGNWSATAPSWSRCGPGSRRRCTACWPSRACFPRCRTCSGRPGRRGWPSAPLDLVYRQRIHSLLELIDAYDGEIDLFRQMIAGRFTGHRGYRVIQQISGVGPTFAAVFVAEIGDVSRFSRPEKLCCWAGLTPRHRESDTTVHRGPITKQGSKLVRWAAIEACQRTRPGSQTGRRPDPDHRPPRPQHRRGRRRPQTAHPGLLRPARRRDPRARRKGRREQGSDPDRARGRCLS